MSISDKTRKILWGKSGNRCAFCKIELTISNESDTDLNIGEECHIISSKPNGPRYKASMKSYDDYDNLILLCRNHHKEIDSLVETFPEEILRAVKQNHEKWVKESLAENVESKHLEKIRFLTRITTGKELANILFGSYGYRMDYDQPINDEEATYVGNVLQNLMDYGEMSDVFEILDKVNATIELQHILDDLEDKNFLLYGERFDEPLNKIGKYPVATIVIRKIVLEE